MKLPFFEGTPTDTAWLSLSGTIQDESAQPARALLMEDDELVLVVRARVTGIKHTNKKIDGEDVMVRQHIVTITEAYETIPDALSVARHDAELAREAERVATTGQHRLPTLGLPDRPYGVDENGEIGEPE